MDITIKWLEHEFTVYRHDADWHNVAGLYIFSGKDPTDNKWFPLYIGQALSLSERLPTHEKWSAAVRLGATHVHAMVVPLATRRDSIERQLIETFQPSLNRQLK